MQVDEWLMWAATELHTLTDAQLLKVCVVCVM